MKYPFSSAKAESANGKFGFFYDQIDTMRNISSKLGLLEKENGVFARHPFAYLVEAADDIAYLTTDVEDGCKMGLIRFREAEIFLTAIASAGEKDFIPERYDVIKGQQDRIKFLRSAAMTVMVKHCIDTFSRNVKNLLAGDLPKNHELRPCKDLLGASEISEQCLNIRNLCVEKLYYQRTKVIKEAGAYELVRQLLSMFSEAIEEYFDVEKKVEEMNDRNVNLLRILAKGRRVEELWPDDGWIKNHPNDYHAAYVTLVNFVSGMTDRFATKLCYELRGDSLLNHSLIG